MKPLGNRIHSRLPKFIVRLSNTLSLNRVPARLIFIVIGFLSTVWFLARVIPKPSRATYPCMRVAYPFMSGFITYLLGLGATVFAYKKTKEHLANARYLAAAVFLVITIFSGIFFFTNESIPVYANSKTILPANNPIGSAKGIFPGRVVWVWNPNSTNENCTNNFGDGWFMDKNTNMSVVNDMVAEAVMKLTGKMSVIDAWDGLFKYFNKNHGKGETGYKDGEKIFIRTNQVSASSGTYDKNTFAILNRIVTVWLKPLPR